MGWFSRSRVRAGAAGALLLASITVALAAMPATASAAVPGMPPKGKVLLGVGGGSADPLEFAQVTGTRHHIHLTFVGWGQGDSWGSSFDSWLEQARSGGYRAMFHMGTKRGGAEAITPRAIARGLGDEYLVEMSTALNRSGQVVYVRPMAEMNGHWNVYSAFNKGGSRRDANHSTSAYRQAFRRIAIIMRGGTAAQLNTSLARAGLPGVSAGDLPASGNVALVWNPQGEGSPNVRGNQPADYYPGPSYVDYVANDLYAENGRAHWSAQERLYSAYPRHPFMMAEWAPWGRDDVAFVDRMFGWVKTHPRTVGLIYFNGSAGDTFRLSSKPRSRSRYRAHVTSAARYRCDMCSTYGLQPVG